MTMVFSPNWDQAQIKPVPVLAADASNKKKKNRQYIIDNNQKRADGAVFLEFFGETALRNAIQRANPLYHGAEGMNGGARVEAFPSRLG